MIANMIANLPLCRVTQNSRTISNQQEVDRNRHHNHIRRRSIRDVGRVPLQVRLARTRDVEVAARLVAAREQSHVDEQRADVVRRAQSGAAIVEGHVAVEERVAEVVEDDDTVGGERHVVNGRHVQVVLIRHHRGNRRAEVTEWDLGDTGAGNARARRVDLAREAVPVAPNIVIRRIRVPLRAHADEHIFDGPLQLTEQDLTGLVVDRLPLLAIDADQRKPDALDVDVVNFRVHKDVVDVQLNRVNGDLRDTSLLEDGRVTLGAQSGAVGSIDLVMDGFQIDRRELEGQQVLGAQVDRDKALAERNRHGRDRQTHVIVEPETQLVPDLEGRLSGLRGLRAINHQVDLTRHVKLVLDKGASLTLGVQRNDGRVENGRDARGPDRRAGQLGRLEQRDRLVALSSGGTSDHVAGRLLPVLVSHQRLIEATVAFDRDFLADQAVEAGALMGRRAELLQHGGHHVVIGIEGVAVDIELHPTKQTIARELAVADKVLVRNRVGQPVILRADKHVAKRVDDVVRRRVGSRSNIRRECRSALERSLLAVGAKTRQAHAAHHVVKEVTELRDAEGDA